MGVSLRNGGHDQVADFESSNQNQVAVKDDKIKTQIVNHGNEWWKIKTGIGEDYQYNHGLWHSDDEFQDESVAEALTKGDGTDCSSDQHGSVGFAIDTTS